jgi:hypothetical protein
MIMKCGRTQDDGEQHDNLDYMSVVLPSGKCNDVDHGCRGSSKSEQR